MSTSTANMTNAEKEVGEEYASSLSDLTVNSKPLINVLTILAHENITHAPTIVQTVERHLQQVPADMKLPVLYLIDSIVKNVADTYTSLFTQNIVSTFCSVFEKVDERTRAQMFKLRQTWNEVFPAKKLYAIDVRVNSIDPAWPITAVPPTIHVNPKFFRQQQQQVPPSQPQPTSSAATAVSSPTPSVSTVSTVTTVVPSVASTLADDPHTLNEAKMREQLLKKQKELLELQQKKLELELLQTKARLEEQQKQLDRQLRVETTPPILTVIQNEAAKLLASKIAETAVSKKLQKVTSVPVSKTITTSTVVPVTVPEATVTTAAVVPAKSSQTTSGNSRSKSESSSSSSSKMSDVTSTVSSTSRPVPTPAVTTVTPSVRSRDPRLACRQVQPTVAPVDNTPEPQDEEMQEPDTIFEPVKLETAKPKPHITINIGCVNKGTINKDTRGISKKDPRLLSNKVQGISNTNVKGRMLSANSSGVGKGGSKSSGKGPSPSSATLPSSPSRPVSSNSSAGKTTSSSSSTSPRKTQSKNINNNSSSSNGNLKPIRNKAIPKIIKIDLTESPPPKTGDIKEESVGNKDKEKENNEISKRTSSPSSKTEIHKKKSSSVASSRSSSSSSSSSSSLSSERKKVSKSDNDSLAAGENSNTNSNKRERVKSPLGGEKKRNYDHSASKFDMFVESDGESPSPPPPPVISLDVKKRDESSPTKSSAFKDVKASTKGRNYMRRNRRSMSRSPEIPPVIATGDIDLRMGGPPEKHPRLNMFQPETKVPVTSADEEIKINVTEPHVEVANKDIDLRQLTGSPSKKRASMEKVEQPPPKKSKAEVFDELFGNEDVDLRQLAPAVAIVKQPEIPPSPPPPPIISQPSPVPTSTSSQDSSLNTISSPKRSSPDREREKEDAESRNVEAKSIDDDSKENSEGGSKSRGWAKYKETYKSPLRPLVTFHDELELPKSQNSTPGSNSPLRERDVLYGTPRAISHFHRNSGKFDRLGRPLLYHRLPDDPGERRRSLNAPAGEDTDMRQALLEERQVIDINVDMIMHQADEQLKNGTISFPQYNILLKQVIQLNEFQKLREAQRRDQQENKENWERSRKRCGPVGIAPDSGHLSPISADEESQGGGSSLEARFGDIDERFSAMHKPRNPVTTSVPSPPEPSMPGSGTFTSAPSQWNEMGHPHMGGGHWEPPPQRWLRGAPGPPMVPPPPQVPLPTSHMPPHIRMINPGQPGMFHRPPGPEFQPMNNFGGVGRWRPPQFQPRPPFESEGDRFQPRFSGRIDNRFRIAAPSIPQEQQHRLHPQEQQHRLNPQEQQHRLNPQEQQHRLNSDELPSGHRLNSDELPPADPMVLDMIAQDTMKTINIDNVPREIRFYGDIAIAMLTWDDPREIKFQGGSRRITIDDRDSIVCNLNDAYRECIIDGSPHRIRIGAPTRELYVNGRWYECLFGGPPISIEIGGKMHSVKLEGPPPQVKIDVVKRTDLIAGKINLIIDARTMVPVFLDAKPQRFDIEGKAHVLRFVEAFSTVLINGQPIKVEFGGLPKPIIVRGKKHFIRFTVLPRGIKAGYVSIVNMEGGRLPSPPRLENENSNSAGFPGEEDSGDATGKFQQGHNPVLPILGGASSSGGRGGLRGLRRPYGTERDRDSPQDTEHARRSPGQFHGENAVMGPIVPLQQPRNRTQGQLPLEMLTSLMPTMMAPASGYSYQVEQDSQDSQLKPQELQPMPAPVPVGVSETSLPSAGGTASIPFLPTEINVDELFKKLVDTGIVPQSQKAEAEMKKEEEVQSVKHVDFKQSDTLKVRQPGVVAVLYSGIQCSSCGVRFPPEQTMKYSQHLDWHFRQNRRDRDNTRKAQSRKWYYDVSDWIQFEEIEDLEERAQSWFETQQVTGEEEKEVQEVPSVCAGENPEDTFCDVCHDKFEQFYNEEREEWHLRAAVRVDGKTYHPVCYEDYKASLEVSVEEQSIVEPKEDEEAKKDGEDGQEQKDKDVKMEETPSKEKAEAMDTSEASEIKEEKKEEEEHKTEGSKEDAKIETIETELKDIKLEPANDESSTQKENAETNDQEENVKTETDKVPEESIIEDDVVESITTAVDTTLAEVVSSIDGNVQFEESPQITTTGPIPGKIKINITKPLSTTSKDPQSEEGDVETPAVAQCVDNEAGPVQSETNMESGENRLGDEEVNSGEPPPPGVEPVQLKPRLVGRKLTELPPVMKGTELSGLCSIM